MAHAPKTCSWTERFALVLGYLLNGSDEMYLSKSWRESRMREQAEHYTTRQLDQGAVTKDSAAFKRDAFWAAHEAKSAPKINLVKGRVLRA